MNLDLMERQIHLHEGERLKPYKDTEGYWTIARGYNIDARGWDFLEEVIGRNVSDRAIPEVRITKEESAKVTRADILRIERIIRKLLPEYASLDGVRQRVCVDMAYNLGYRARNFEKSIDAIRHKDWSRWARELFKSKWAKQVDDGEGGRFGRADRLAKMALTGQEPDDPEWIAFIKGA